MKHNKFNMPLKISRYRDFVRERLSVEPCRMMEEFFSAEGRVVFAEREALRHKITRLEIWNKERERIRKNLILGIGEEPNLQHVDLKNMRVIRKPAINIYKFIFSFRPGDWIPANLYAPSVVSNKNFVI